MAFSPGDTVRLTKLNITGTVVTADPGLVSVGVAVELRHPRTDQSTGTHTIQVLPADLELV